jgi:methylglutaconyl-CoA hydratase
MQASIAAFCEKRTVMMTPVLCDVSKHGVATLTLNRPEVHNAFDQTLMDCFLQHFDAIEKEPDIRLVVLAAKGKSFCAGADLNSMQAMANYSFEDNLRDAEKLSALMHRLKHLPQPTIAKVQGPAFGGGVGLVACCDMAIGGMVATFCLSEVKIGLMPAVISPYIIAAIGERAARYYSLSADMFAADEALRLGLLTRVVPDLELDQALENLLQKMLKNSPAAMRATKQLLARVSHNPQDPAHQKANVEAIAKIRISPEGQEGLKAFLEKRRPSWLES